MTTGSSLGDGQEFVMGQLEGEILLGLEVVHDVFHEWISDTEEQERSFALGVFCDLMHMEAEALFAAWGRDCSFEHRTPMGGEVVQVLCERDFWDVSQGHESTTISWRMKVLLRSKLSSNVFHILEATLVLADIPVDLEDEKCFCPMILLIPLGLLFPPGFFESSRGLSWFVVWSGSRAIDDVHCFVVLEHGFGSIASVGDVALSSEFGREGRNVFMTVGHLFRQTKRY